MGIGLTMRGWPGDSAPAPASGGWKDEEPRERDSVCLVFWSVGEKPGGSVSLCPLGSPQLWVFTRALPRLTARLPSPTKGLAMAQGAYKRVP